MKGRDCHDDFRKGDVELRFFSTFTTFGTPGLGYSEVPEGQSLAPEAQASMFSALLDALAIPAVDLVASDSGGAIAQLFVARYPEFGRSC